MNEELDLGKHGNRYISWDSCLLHGIGFGPCRTCAKNSRTGDAQAKAKHIAGYDVRGYHVCEGQPHKVRA